MSRVSANSGLAGRVRSADARQTFDLAVAGAVGAVFGLYFYVEAVHATSVYVRDALAGASIGGASGLVLGEVVIGAFRGGLVGRAASWAVLGVGIGVSQGLAERSRQKLVFGVLGGLIGGAAGGYLFEALRLALGNRYDLSQGFGIAILGAGLGASLALVEQALRRAWVQVLSGRQEGRSYLLGPTRSRLGLDERAEVGLFGDALIERRHAEIEATPSGYVLHNAAAPARTKVKIWNSPFGGS